MLGAIAGDIIGSVHEGAGTKHRDFPLFVARSTFTDDTVLSVAVAEALLHGGDYVTHFHAYYHRYPDAGFGGNFARWAERRDTAPYYSWGNGSAMRVSPVGFAAPSLDDALDEAKRSASVTHNHPEGIRGAQAVAAAIYLARDGAGKAEIKRQIESRFGYNLSTRLDALRPGYGFDVSCQGSVPPSIVAFLESDSVEGAMRNAISLGGDADTMACIAGGIAEAFHGGLPDHLHEGATQRLDPPLREIVDAFRDRFITA
ncbi:ADP-ribosylglycohydrolase family protein [Halomonas sp. TRM85114]|uniref:ADP-ribosylglycohydrolase family protein n=1 Tax=Halomonas jincaotanensis TaxID=2810616 RepID=UPI001BD2DC93|nr:ADP-ribosylglycohydrolase family protein [Halomonas jincaotanensis]MBS9402252.1 ADP-ribosylglycohydrolase family protein [Halomonas jincaotanensis]